MSWSLAISGLTTQNPASCGYAQSFSATVQPAFKSPASFFFSETTSSIKFSIETSEVSDAGQKTITVTSTLLNYNVPGSQTPFASKSFVLYIYTCLVTGFNMGSIGSNRVYTIMDPAQEWQLALSSLTSQTPSCGYDQTFSLSVTPPFYSESVLNFRVTANSLQFQLYTSNLADAGLRTVTLTSTLLNYDGPVPVPTASSSFQLDIEKSCKAAKIVAIAHAPITSTIAAPATSTTPIWFDTFSGSAQLQLCGPLTITVTNKEAPKKFDETRMRADFYWSQNQTHSNLTSSPTQAAEEGSYLFEFLICLRDYPEVDCAIFDSKVEVTKCYISKFQFLSLSPSYDQSYTIGSEAKKWSLYFNSLTQQTPACRYSEEFNITFSPKMRALDSLIWTFSESSIDFMIQSQDLDDEMAITVIIWSTLVDYTQDASEATPAAKGKFTITVNAPLSQDRVSSVSKNSQPSKSAPYFEYALETQAVSMSCKTQSTGSWSFLFPKIIDPNDLLVTADFKFDQDVFILTKDPFVIRLQTVITSDTTQTVEVTLTNEMRYKKKYSMDIRFFCLTTPPETQKRLESLANQTNWPAAYIRLIEPSGLVRIKFKQQMIVPKGTDNIRNGTVVLNETLYPILMLEILPGTYSDSALLKFNWSVVDYKPTELTLKLDFENANYISTNTPADSIRVTIYGFEYFVDTVGNFMQVPTVLKQTVLPRMASQNELKAIQSTTSSFSSFFKATGVGNTVVAFISAGPLQFLLDQVKQLQIITHTMMIQVAYPATSVMFFRMFMELVTFQVIDCTDYYNRALGLNPDSDGNQPLNDLFQRMGYGAQYTIQNFGFLCLTLLITPVMYVASMILAAVSSSRFGALREEWTNLMFFDAWIQFINETYLFLAVCVCINCYFFSWQTTGDAINSLTTLVMGFMILAFPIFFGVFYKLKKNYSSIIRRDKLFLAKFGSAVADLDFANQGRKVLLYRLAQTLRKLWLALILVFQQKRPVFNIFMVNFQSIAMVTIIGFTEPLIDKIQYRLDFVNEAFNLGYTYHLYLFTDYMRDLKIRDLAGKLLISAVVLNIAVNLGVVVWRTASIAINKIKRYYVNLKQRKARVQIQLNKKKLLTTPENIEAVVDEIFIEDQDQLEGELKRRQLNQLDKNLSSNQSGSSYIESSEYSQSEISASSLSRSGSDSQRQSSSNSQSVSDELSQSQSSYHASQYSESDRRHHAQTEISEVQTSSQLVTLTNKPENAAELEVGQQQQMVQLKTKMPNLLTRLSENLKFSSYLGLNPGIFFRNFQTNSGTHVKPEPKTGASSTIESNPAQQVVIDAQTSSKNEKLELKETRIDGKPTSLQFYVDGILHKQHSVQETVIGQVKVKENIQLLREHMNQKVLGISAQVQADVKSGKMQRTLNYYKKLRDNNQLTHHPSNSLIAIKPRTDFGDVTPNMTLQEKIDLYTKLKKEEAQQRQVRNPKFRQEKRIQRFV